MHKNHRLRKNRWDDEEQKDLNRGRTDCDAIEDFFVKFVLFLEDSREYVRNLID